MILLEYMIKQGEICEEPNRTAINTIDLKHFVEEKKKFLKNKEILDIACGEAYLSKREDLSYKSYIGLDNTISERAYPDVLADFEILPFNKEKFDIVFSLQKIPFNLGGVKEVIKQGGYFIHQSGEFYYKKHDTERIISLYFKIVDKKDYLIQVYEHSGELINELQNIFIIGQKLD